MAMTVTLPKLTITRDDITLVIACIGAVLGIFTLISDWRRRRVRITVVPFLHADTSDGGNLSWRSHSPTRPKEQFINGPFFGIELRNHGVPVKIEQVGLTRRSDKMLFTFTDLLPNGDQLPARMENEDSLHLFTNVTPSEVWSNLGEPNRGYVLTSTDKMFTGDSDALSQLRSAMREKANEIKERDKR
jgi:hypothetical protein